jgi:hypothetical protein
MKLVTMMAKACHYAQSHIDDQDAWKTDEEARLQLLQCVSFQMACFFAQNTVRGSGGVEWEVVIEELIKHPMKSEKQWEKILDKIAEELGGWTKDSADEIATLKNHLNKVITAAEIIDGQDSPPDDDDVDYLHKVIRNARKAMKEIK